MVERQYEILKRPRTLEEANVAKNFNRPDSHDLNPNIGPAAPINAVVNVSNTEPVVCSTKIVCNLFSDCY